MTEHKTGVQVTQPVPPGRRDGVEELTTLDEIRRAMLKADPDESHIARCEGGVLLRAFLRRGRRVVIEEMGGRLRLYLQDMSQAIYPSDSLNAAVVWVGPITDQELLRKNEELGIRQSPYVDYLNVERVRELIRWEQGGIMPEWVPSRRQSAMTGERA